MDETQQQAAIEAVVHRGWDINDRIEASIQTIRDLREDLARTVTATADIAVSPDREDGKRAHVEQLRAHLATVDCILKAAT